MYFCGTNVDIPRQVSCLHRLIDVVGVKACPKVECIYSCQNNLKTTRNRSSECCILFSAACSTKSIRWIYSHSTISFGTLNRRFIQLGTKISAMRMLSSIHAMLFPERYLGDIFKSVTLHAWSAC